MGKEFEKIDDRISQWIDKQHMFFVSTAPLAGDGLVNCSPKGLDGLRVLGPHKMVYADIGGSGIETVAHIKENGRIVIMLCSFEGPPKIFRFYGQGNVIEPGDDNWESYSTVFSHLHTVRNFIEINVTLIRDACGFGVPTYEFVEDRKAHQKYIANKTPEELNQGRRRNLGSLDGLAGLKPGSVER